MSNNGNYEAQQELKLAPGRARFLVGGVAMKTTTTLSGNVVSTSPKRMIVPLREPRSTAGDVSTAGLLARGSTLNAQPSRY
jgi:hypothetical protein